MNESPTPSRFEYTIGMNQNATLVLVLSLAVMVIAVAITMVVIADSSPELWFIPLVLLVSGGIVARVISQTFVTYTIDEEGFLKHGRGGVKERVLTWRDISALKPRRSGVEGVELVDNKGAVPVKMYGQLRGYEHFVQLLPRMRPDLWDFQTTRTFQKTGLFFGMGLLTLFFSSVRGICGNDWRSCGIVFLFWAGCGYGLVAVANLLPSGSPAGCHHR